MVRGAQKPCVESHPHGAMLGAVPKSADDHVTYDESNLLRRMDNRAFISTAAISLVYRVRERRQAQLSNPRSRKDRKYKLFSFFFVAHLHDVPPHHERL